MKAPLNYAFLLLLIVLATSCSRRSDALSFIPEETPVVVSFNVRELADKAHLEDWDELVMFQELKSELKNESNRLSRRVNRFIDDPLGSGMDLSKEIYLFSGGLRGKNNYSGVVIDMKDRDDFEAFVKGMLEETDTYFEHKKVNEHRAFMLDRNRMAIVYDKKRILVLVPNGYGSRNDMIDIIRDLSALGQQDQLIADKRFSSFLDETEDVGVWLNGKALESMVSRREMRKLKQDYGYDFTENSVSMNLVFKKNEIRMHSKALLSEKSQQFVNKWNLFNKDVDDDLLEFLPGNPTAALGFAIDMEGLREAIASDSTMSEMEDRLKRQVRDDVPVPYSTLDQLNGEFVFDFYGFKEVKETYYDYETFYDSLGYQDYRKIEKTRMKRQPLYAMAIGMNNTDSLQAYLKTTNDAWAKQQAEFEAKPAKEAEEEEEESDENYYGYSSKRMNAIERMFEQPFLLKNGDSYSIPLAPGNLQMAHKEEHVLLTNDDDLIKAYTADGTVRNNLSESEFGKEIADNHFFAAMELDASRVREELDADLPRSAQSYVETADDFLKRFYVKANGQEADWVIETHPGDGNTLWRILLLMDEVYQESRER